MIPATQNAIYWLVGGLTVALVPQLLSMPPHLALVVAAPMIWRLLAEWKGWKPFSLWVRVPIVLVVVTLLVLHYGTLIGRRAAVGLLAVMLALKLLETFSVRDARVIASLSLFLVVTQFLFSQSPMMLAYGMAVCGCSLVSLTLLARQSAFGSKSKTPPLRSGLFPEFSYMARLLVVAIPVCLALFFLFPRWGSPLWGVPENALDSRSGLSDSMSPGTIQSLFMDDSPAFRAVFDSRLPRNNDRYWRGPVFWNFDGRTWTGSFVNRNIDASDIPEAGESDYLYTVQLEPHERRWLFALDTPAIKPRGSRMSLDYQLLSRRPITRLTEYEMRSDPDFVDSPELKRTLRRAALDLPQGFNPQTRELMASWRQQSGSDIELVNRTLAYFNSEGFEYSLNPPLLTRHTVDEFLFETRSGFCEHYASSFAIMMRMAGIPSRIVTGYQGGWYNGIGSYLLVRQSDAHAWAEVWLPEQGWTRVDPTAAVAPSRIQQNARDVLDTRRHLLDFSWVRNMRNGFDLAGRWWNDWVVAFDAAAQSGILERFGFQHLDAQKLVALLALVLLVVAAVCLPLLLYWVRRRGRDPATHLWQGFLRQLSSAGIEVNQTMGPLEVAHRAREHAPGNFEPIEQVARDYLGYRYGFDGPDLESLQKSMQTFRKNWKKAS